MYLLSSANLKRMRSFFVPVVGLIGFIFYSQNIGRSDFGFRIEKIDIKLSQKFPPAIAYELLDQELELVSPEPSSFEVIPLSVGFPDLGPVQLEELSFGILEGTQRESVAQQKRPNRGEINLDEGEFNDEEKTRLRMAKLQNGLEIEDILPRHEVSFSERAKEVIENQLNAVDHTSDSVKVSKPEEEAGSRSVVIHQDLKEGTAIQGEIEFVRDGSLALTDKHIIDVRRFEEGVPKEVAQVDLLSGTFTMNIKNTKGLIIGRLTNQRGGIEGEGLISVSDLLNSKDRKLILKKLAARETLRASSAYGKGSQEGSHTVSLAGLPGNATDSNTKYDINAFDPTSELVAEASSKKHIPTVSMVNLMGGAELVMLPERMVAGLTEILAEQDIQLDLDRGDSLIWGTVKLQGRAAEGATVIAGQGRASYFGGLYLPDQTRSKTSENGMFAVVVHNPGWNDLYVELQSGRGVHVNALAYPGKITQVIADIPVESEPVTIRTFDAFSGEPVRAKVDIQQFNDTIDTGAEGATVIDLPKTKNLSFVSAEPEAPFEKVRLTYTHLLDFLHIPLFSKSWVDSLRSNIKVNDLLQTGTVVGFVQGDDFIVEIPNKETLSRTVYFDPQGRAVEHGIAGGGFVIFNLEEDSPNLVVISERTEKEISRIVKPESEFIQVVNLTFE